MASKSFKITLGQLWKRYAHASHAELRSRQTLNEYLHDLHVLDIRISLAKDSFKQALRNAGPQTIALMKRDKFITPKELVNHNPKAVVIISGRDYHSLISNRKDLNILIRFYKKQHQQDVIRKNKYLQLYRNVLEHAKTINTDPHFLSEFPVVITETTSKNYFSVICSWDQ